jgi:hypothetical protein
VVITIVQEKSMNVFELSNVELNSKMQTALAEIKRCTRDRAKRRKDDTAGHSTTGYAEPTVDIRGY